MMKTWITSGALPASLLAVGASIASWKVSTLDEAAGAPPAAEPAEAVSAVVARASEHRESSTAIGTVLALRSVTLRNERLREHNASTDVEVDRVRAERDVTLAQIARTQAVIARKTIRVPFRARIGLADVHPGQYLNEGTALTTTR